VTYDAPVRALILSIGLLATLAACNEGDKKMPPFGSKSSAWNELSVAGAELFVERDSSPPYRASGAARVDGRGMLRGKDAFDATRSRVGNDATALATLAMLFIDDGVAGRKPWTKPDGSQVPDQQAIARPPAVSGDNLVYWRAHIQSADLVRCRASLSRGEVSCEMGGDVLQAERIARDPAGTARQDLASDNPYVRARGIQALGHVGDAASRSQLIDLALNAYSPLDRRTAVETLGKVGGPGVVDAVSRILLYDKGDEVRQAAATALGELRDPAGRDALQRAEQGDSNARVQVLAADALKQLGN
jgi:HEAT repeat protein